MLQAGSLSGNLPKWREFTSDPWILQTVSGYHLEFETTPHQVNLPKFPKFSERETAMIESEINKLISKGAVTEVSPCDNEFISTVFLVPKKTGDFRPVINLKSDFFWGPREIEKSRHMMEKKPILIFRPEIPYSKSINVV